MEQLAPYIRFRPRSTFVHGSPLVYFNLRALVVSEILRAVALRRSVGVHG